MKEVIYKDIAKYINKSEQSIKGYKANNPQLLEILKLGSFCKKNNITLEFLETCTKIQEISSMLDDKKD